MSGFFCYYCPARLTLTNDDSYIKTSILSYFFIFLTKKTAYYDCENKNNE